MVLSWLGRRSWPGSSVFLQEGIRNLDYRRNAIKAGIALAASQALPLWAEKPTLRFSAVFSDKDIRADMVKMFAKISKPKR